MINVINPKVPFFKLPFDKAVEDFYVINKKKWFKIMSFSFFILNLVSNVLFILYEFSNQNNSLARLRNYIGLYIFAFWLVCFFLPIIECFFINWYVFVFCTILIVLTFAVFFYIKFKNRALIVFTVHRCFSYMWLSYLIANCIFTDKIYQFLFFIFTWVFLLLFNVALAVCKKQKWLGLDFY